MKHLTLTLLSSLLILTSAKSSLADESVGTIALQQGQKEQLAAALTAQIARHQSMTQGQIIADIQATSDQAQSKLEGASNATPEAIQSYATQKQQYLAQMASLPDADTIVALEQAQLQQLMSSDNYIFWATRSTFDGCYNPKGDQTNTTSGLCNLTTAFDMLLWPFFPVTVAVDIALFIPELIISAITGF